MSKKEMNNESNKEEANGLTNGSTKEEVMSGLITHHSSLSTPDVVGYRLQEACSILEQAGYQVAVVATGSPWPYPARVLRQRQLHENLIELTKGYELYQDPGADEKEVRDSALQDH